MKPVHWLRSNRRPFVIILAFAAVILSLCVLLWIFGSWGILVQILLGSFLSISCLLIVALLLLIQQSRLVCDGTSLLVGLDWIGYRKVPLEVVECFFIGQAPSMMIDQDGASTEAATVVVRLAEADNTWHRCQVNSLFGQWCDGYIIVRGTWSEPLDRQKVEWMNHQLLAAKRKLAEKNKSEQTNVRNKVEES